LRTGSAIVRGRVTATDGRPVPHAHLRLTPDGDILQTRVAAADAEGRFEFRDLGAGTARVFASKTGYDPIEVERTVEIAEQQTRDGVDLTLARWSALSGQVVDDGNEPIAGATVQALQLRYDGGRRRLVPAGAARLTNDLGRYRLYGLRPGQYVVTAALSGSVPADVPDYTRSYYPGTANPAGAQFVSIGVAHEVGGIDIALVRARTARVAGMVVNASGHPANPGSLSLVSSVRSASPVSVSIGARLAADGSFEFLNVPPGQYVIRADRGRLRPWVEGEFGTLAVALDGGDVTNLIVQTSAGSAITGRVTFNARDRSKLPVPSALELRPLPVDFDAVPSSVATANIHDDWTFEMMGVNGPRRLELTRVPPGWALQDVRVNGIDITDRPLPFGRREQSLNDTEVTVTDRITELNGTIVAADARAAQTAAVIVFASDRSRWYPESRFMRKTTAGSEGAFSVTGLPFGSYYVAAVASLTFSGADDWQDPAFLETLVFRASTVTLAEGRKETIKLELPKR
jgi:Carboxypeptidase regulatory-like domain